MYVSVYVCQCVSVNIHFKVVPSTSHVLTAVVFNKQTCTSYRHLRDFHKMTNTSCFHVHCLAHSSTWTGIYTNDGVSIFCIIFLWDGSLPFSLFSESAKELRQMCFLLLATFIILWRRPVSQFHQSIKFKKNEKDVDFLFLLSLIR